MIEYERELYRPTLVEQSTLNLMWTPNFPLHNDNWRQQGYVAGLGWWVINYDNRQIVSHNGSILGFAGNITRYIDDGITVILLCNLDKIARPDVIAKEIAGYYCPEIADLPIQPAIKSI